MAYRSRRSPRRSTRRAAPRRSYSRRTYGRRSTRRAPARPRASTVRIELVTSPAGGAARPEMLGLMPASAPRTKPVF